MPAATGLTAIVGAGIAGLSAAWTLHQQDRAFLLLEAENRCGGTVRTEREDGFVYEGGPDSFLASKTAALDLCRELGLEEELIAPRPQPLGPRVWQRGRLQPIPSGWRLLAPTRLLPVLRSPLFSPAVKAAIAWHWRRIAVPAREQETVAAYLERRFGAFAAAALSAAVTAPLLAGVYGGDPARLGATWAQPAPALAHGGPMFLSFRGGMEVLVGRLQEKLRPHMRLGWRVRSVQADGAAGYLLESQAGERIEAARLLLALPAWQAAARVRELDPELEAALAAIPYASSINVNAAFRQAPVLPRGHGFVASGAGELLACTFAHQKFAGRAPRGGALLRLFYGEALATASEERMAAQVCADLQKLLGITTPPDRLHLRRCLRALPQYTPAHGQILRRLRAALQRHPALALAGNAYSGLGVPDCIASGRAAAAGRAAGIQ
ncbi:MAG: protoporphyrinogen/coproporphyrinogen oxidase [Terriglobales bacterium]